jgi:hypothetical protein
MGELGQEDEALEILMQMQKLHRDQHWYQRPESWLLRWSIVYRYHPLWAFWELVVLGGVVGLFTEGPSSQAMAPTNPEAYASYKIDGVPPASYTRFSPPVSVENSLTLVKLGQADKWHPDPDALVGFWRHCLLPELLASFASNTNQLSQCPFMPQPPVPPMHRIKGVVPLIAAFVAAAHHYIRPVSAEAASPCRAADHCRSRSYGSNLSFREMSLLLGRRMPWR